ncbi:hypothetical protein CHELA1G2_14423 [Hyphomicrobiales bacterium]|nr:hypothetical protein CHELA1G2_14423 [Hyphomicrobiales bacterium]
MARRRFSSMVSVTTARATWPAWSRRSSAPFRAASDAGARFSHPDLYLGVGTYTWGGERLYL